MEVRVPLLPYVCIPTPPLGTHSHACDTLRTPPHPPPILDAHAQLPAHPMRVPPPPCAHTHGALIQTPLLYLAFLGAWDGEDTVRGTGGDTRTKAVTRLRSEAGP